MAEYIEREAVLKSICNSCDGWCDNTECDCMNCKSDHRCDMVEEISDFPAADVAPVVQCGKCVFWDRGLCSRKMLGLVRPEDFCSFGKRRMDGE